MADYYASSHTNYFKVKDKDAFVQAIGALRAGLSIHAKGISNLKDASEEDPFKLVCENTEGWPSHDLSAEDIEVDWPGFFRTHLAEGQVVVIKESGYEKNCYIGGWATAISWEGQTWNVNIDKVKADLGQDFEISMS